MEIFLAILKWVVMVICLVGAWGCVILMSRMRSTLRKTRRELILANRRSRHWKHYAHVLEVKLFTPPTSKGDTDGIRDTFRARYITDFQGWGTEDGERAQS